MIAKTTHHLFQPLLYQVATGILSQGEIAPPTREILSRQQQRPGAARRGHRHRPRAPARSPRTSSAATTVTPYDSLIVAAGAGQSYFGNDHFAEYAPGMKSIDDALELRGRIFGAFEMAELGAARGEDVDHLLTFVVVGAGPTGVEMAGQIAELAHRTLKRDFRAINTRDARVILLDAAPAGAAAVRRRSSARRPRRELEKLGVEVHARRDGHRRRRARHRGAVQGRPRPSGSRRSPRSGPPASRPARSASTLAEQTGAPLDRAGRIGVNPDLTLPGHPEVFVVGDMIALDNLPGVAQVAIQGAQVRRQGDRAAGSRASRRSSRSSTSTRARMATIISRFRAVAMIGKLRLTGFLAWLMWLAVHLVYITGFKNRVTALLHWVGLVPRPRPLRAHHDRAADLRPGRAGRLKRGAADLVSDPGAYDAARAMLETTRRAELEARAAEEARLTDAGERGKQKVS